MTTSRSASHPMLIVPTRNSSSMGVSRGAMSSMVSPTASEAAPPAKSSSRSLIRSASVPTCCFSSDTLVSRDPALAWRKKVRCPGGPTVPATNRSGGSNSRTGIRSTLISGSSVGGSSVEGIRAAGTRAATHDRVPGEQRGWGYQAGEVGPSIIEPHHERAPICVAHHGQRRRADHEPLEMVQMGAGSVGQDRLDDVAVGDQRPQRLGPMVGTDPCVDLTDCLKSASLHLGDGLPREHLAVGEPRGTRLVLHLSL